MSVAGPDGPGAGGLFGEATNQLYRRLEELDHDRIHCHVCIDRGSFLSWFLCGIRCAGKNIPRTTPSLRTVGRPDLRARPQGLLQEWQSPVRGIHIRRGPA